MSSIKVERFVKRYKTKTVQIDELMISAPFTLLVGANGTGKSTVMKAVAGLIRYEGLIEVTGDVMYLPERPLFPKYVSVRAFLDAFEDEIDIEPLYDLFALREKEQDDLESLSKGMQAKVQLMQCLCKDVTWYLLDEPLSGLDGESIEMLIDWLQTHQKKCVIATHQPEQWNQVDAAVIVLD